MGTFFFILAQKNLLVKMSSFSYQKEKRKGDFFFFWQPAGQETNLFLRVAPGFNNRIFPTVISNSSGSEQVISIIIGTPSSGYNYDVVGNDLKNCEFTLNAAI